MKLYFGFYLFRAVLLLLAASGPVFNTATNVALRWFFDPHSIAQTSASKQPFAHSTLNDARIIHTLIYRVCGRISKEGTKNVYYYSQLTTREMKR